MAKKSMCQMAMAAAVVAAAEEEEGEVKYQVKVAFKSHNRDNGVSEEIKEDLIDEGGCQPYNRLLMLSLANLPGVLAA